MPESDNKRNSAVWRWRKRVPKDAAAIAHWESLIEEGFVPNGTIQQTVGGRTVSVEVFTSDAERAEDLRRVFGGSVEVVDAEELMRSNAEIGPPLKIRDRLLATESVDDREIVALAKEFPQRAVLSFPPQLAFGTGRHATTGTCLRLLVDISRERARGGEPWRMLDLGHGSGILAVASVTLGAERAVGVDFDPRSVAAGRRNAERHRVPDGGRGKCSDRCEFLEADISEAKWQPPKSKVGPGGYEVVAANLFADLLVTQLPRIAKWLTPDGDLVLSGILRRQVDQVTAAADAAGIELREPVVRGKWAAIRGRLR